ncbi:hypothetical protein GN956_G11166 [Arapaima gigas]
MRQKALTGERHDLHATLGGLVGSRSPGDNPTTHRNVLRWLVRERERKWWGGEGRGGEGAVRTPRVRPVVSERPCSEEEAPLGRPLRRSSLANTFQAVCSAPACWRQTCCLLHLDIPGCPPRSCHLPPRCAGAMSRRCVIKVVTLTEIHVVPGCRILGWTAVTCRTA